MEKTFEECLLDLEEIVEKLESGDMPLDQSLELFERGVALTKECRKRLETAARRIEVAREEADGRISVEAFDQ